MNQLLYQRPLPVSSISALLDEADQLSAKYKFPWGEAFQGVIKEAQGNKDEASRVAKAEGRLQRAMHEKGDNGLPSVATLYGAIKDAKAAGLPEHVIRPGQTLLQQLERYDDIVPYLRDFNIKMHKGRKVAEEMEQTVQELLDDAEALQLQNVTEEADKIIGQASTLLEKLKSQRKKEREERAAEERKKVEESAKMEAAKERAESQKQLELEKAASQTSVLESVETLRQKEINENLAILRSSEYREASDEDKFNYLQQALPLECQSFRMLDFEDFVMMTQLMLEQGMANDKVPPNLQPKFMKVYDSSNKRDFIRNTCGSVEDMCVVM